MKHQAGGTIATLPFFLTVATVAACSSDHAVPSEATSHSTTDASDSGGDGEAGGAAPWTKLGYDLASTYNNTMETALTRQNAATLEEAHVFDVTSSATGTTLLVEDRAYVMSGSGTFCYELDSGEKCWEDLSIAGSASPAYAEGVLYVHTTDAKLYALSAEDGDVLWGPTSTNDHPNTVGFSSPVVAGDYVLVGGSTGEISWDPAGFRGFVFAADKASGKQAWQTFTVHEDQTGASVWSTVSVDLDRRVVYVSTGNNYQEPASDTSDAILALDLDSGKINWKAQRFGGDVFSRYTSAGPDYDFGANPILFEVESGDTTRRLVAAGQKSGDIHVLDREDEGAEVCSRNLGPGNASGNAGIFVNGAWDGERLLFAENSQTSDEPGSKPQQGSLPTSVLFAIDPVTCDIVWERQLPSIVMGPISVANGVGFVGWDKTLEAFDTATGKEILTYETPATIASAPAISNGRVAVGTGLPWIFGTPGQTVHILALR